MAQRPPWTAISAWCRETLAGYKRPREFRFSDTLPRNPMGKLDKRALRAPFWAGDCTIGG